MSLEVSSDACTGGDSQYYFFKFPFLFGYILFVFCPEIYLWKKIYNRLETNCRKSLIPFHVIWGLCWYNVFFCVFKLLNEGACFSSGG